MERAAGKGGCDVSTELPRVIVFDLDGTLWDPEMYQLRGGSPFRSHADDLSIMIDRSGEEVKLIGESRVVLQTLFTDQKWANTYLAISSTCDEPRWAGELLGKFLFTNREGRSVPMHALFGDRIEIYKANKARHHEAILSKVNKIDPSVSSYKQMLFFDNQTDNIHHVSRIGVPSYYCPSGMKSGTFEKGLEMWLSKQASKM